MTLMMTLLKAFVHRYFVILYVTIFYILSPNVGLLDTSKKYVLVLKK